MTFKALNIISKARDTIASAISPYGILSAEFGNSYFRSRNISNWMSVPGDVAEFAPLWLPIAAYQIGRSSSSLSKGLAMCKLVLLRLSFSDNRG